MKLKIEKPKCNHEILRFYQDTARQRGYPAVPLEIALKFKLEMKDAEKEVGAVKQYIGYIIRNIELPRQYSPKIINARLPDLKMPSFSGKIDLKRFTGRNNGFPDKRDRMIYWHDSGTNQYLRGSVDYILHDEQMALCPQTEPCFYSAQAVHRAQYRKGSRPFLEEVLEETTRGCRTGRAKVMALAKLIGNPELNRWRHYGEWRPFLGGKEEEVLRKAWRMCNEISRVFVFLCQIADIPARGMFLFTDPLTGVAGHAVTEVFFEGKWNLIEQNLGIMFLRKDGYFASAVELRDDPGIINSRKDVGGGLCLSHCCYTGPITILPYSIDQTSQYQYPWQIRE